MQLQINFSFNSYFRTPTVKIGIDNLILYVGDVASAFEFNVPLSKGAHQLWIEHFGKQPNETDASNDTFVQIDSIKFDDIDLDQLEYCRLTHRGKFFPKYNDDYVKDCIMSNISLPEFISPNHYLGHNGTWRIDFQTPALNWIIQEQNPSGMNLEDTMFSSSGDVLDEIKKLFEL